MFEVLKFPLDNPPAFVYADATMEERFGTTLRKAANKEKPAAPIRTLLFNELKECGSCCGFFLLLFEHIELFNIIVIPLTRYILNYRQKGMFVKRNIYGNYKIVTDGFLNLL